jgi:hypothetical protein
MSLDGATRASTLLGLGVVAASLVLGLARAPGGWSTFMPAALVVVLGITWAMAPRGLVVTQNELRIERRAWASIRVPLASVERADALDWPSWRAMRLFGVGGFFGSYGVFHSESLGRFRLYATKRGRAVLVRTRSGQALVLTPDDVAGTIAAIHPPSAACT